MGISTQLLSDITAALSSLKDTLVGLAKEVSKNVVSETVTIIAGQSKAYDLSVLLGTSYSKYDPMGAEVKVRAKDPYPTSTTYNQFINSEALITTAINGAVVTVYNNSDKDLSTFIRIDVPRVKA